jgi:putative membrane protein
MLREHWPRSSKDGEVDMTVVAASPSDTGTRLAVDRTRLAYERTMMAWVRTSASLISFGFTIHKFFQFHAEGAAVPAGRLLGPGRFGGILVATGLIALVLASFDHRRSMNMLRAAYGPMPHSAAAAIGILMAGLGVFALIAMSFGL